MSDQILLYLCIFGAIGLVAYAAWSVLGASEGTGKLRNRLTGKAVNDGTQAQKQQGMMPLLKKMGNVAAEPFMPKTREAQSELRTRLGYAGIYTSSALKLVTGAKVISLGLGLVGGYFLSRMVDGFFMQMAMLSTGGLVGYLAPTFWLKWKIKGNCKALTFGLADALDLMVVCVEAGLTVDSAMQRVGSEMSLAHPEIARELGITHMETRVGLSRVEALKNLGVRTGCEPLQSLAAMLIQADRFGTSIASALRIHADTLRQNRHHAAEELAAKASVKMSFPLVLFIFPATFIVLAGPTVIGLMNSPLLQ
jgi:tight adherence protein C